MFDNCLKLATSFLLHNVNKWHVSSLFLTSDLANYHLLYLHTGCVCVKHTCSIKTGKQTTQNLRFHV